MKLTHASVFSGIGGPEIAATMLGWENVFHCEINEFGRKILEYWYPNSRSYEDITKTDFTEWRGRVNVLTGGFPCQPFSYAGQRRGAEDDRYLWPYMFRCIDQIQPDWVVAENVAGITTMVEQGEVSPMESQGALFDEVDAVRRYRLRETFTLQRICDDLEGHGYAVQPVLVPACAVGAPHRRDRVFIVGRRVDEVERRTSANSTNNGSCGDTASASPKAQRPNRQSNEQSAISSSIRNARLSFADTNGTGQPASDEPSGRTRQTMDGERIGKSFDGTERPCSTRHASDTDSERLERAAGLRVQDDERRGGHDGLRERPWNSGEDGSTRADSDTRHAGLQEAWPEQSSAGIGGHALWDSKWLERLRSLEIAGCGRWQDFPSVSPVHRGNDGLPFSLDDLAIPASKWRTESLKAYGNAIVPQVMYEIFRAIEIVEREKNQ